MGVDQILDFDYLKWISLNFVFIYKEVKKRYCTARSRHWDENKEGVLKSDEIKGGSEHWKKLDTAHTGRHSWGLK